MQAIEIIRLEIKIEYYNLMNIFNKLKIPFGEYSFLNEQQKKSVENIKQKIKELDKKVLAHQLTILELVQ